MNGKRSGIVGGDNPRGRFPGVARGYYPLTLVCHRVGMAQDLHACATLFKGEQGRLPGRKEPALTLILFRPADNLPS